jgi:ribosomal protein S18 acetylase RimI-like enzyme
MNMTIRVASPGDGPAIYELGMAQPGFEVSEGSRFYSRSRLFDWIADPGRDILTVADNSSGLLGFLICRPFADSALLENIAVRPADRHRGVAGMLFDDCLQRLRGLGIEQLNALVREENPALAFFERMGFRVGHRFRWLERDIPGQTDG